MLKIGQQIKKFMPKNNFEYRKFAWAREIIQNLTLDRCKHFDWIQKFWPQASLSVKFDVDFKHF